MKTISLTDVQVNLLLEVLTDSGELITDNYYDEFVESIENGDDVFESTFYGVPIANPLEPNNNIEVLTNEVNQLISLLES